MRHQAACFVTGVLSVGLVVACGASGGSAIGDDGTSAVGAGGAFGSGNSNGGSSFTSGGQNAGLAGNAGAGQTMPGSDPTTCESAAAAKSYVGCDYWPTVTMNTGVWSIFDFAVVLANAGDQPADYVITRGTQQLAKGTVGANDLQKVYLPWVPELKGPDSSPDGTTSADNTSVLVKGGAYHLVTTLPVSVYQFNALEYKGQGGPPGKDWSTCPANMSLAGLACFSYSNDASLLLPSTAMTGNYRIAAMKASPPMDAGLADGKGYGSYFTVTGTQDATTVNVKLSATGGVLATADGTLADSAGGSLINFTLNAGDVMQVVGQTMDGQDISGSLLQADKPVQVVTGMGCTQIPFGTPACDHIEESVFPAETLGKHYFVTVPTGPTGMAIGHVVRIYGNVDGTKLSFPGGAPPGTPMSVNAGQVLDIAGAQNDYIVRGDFEIVGDHEFAVSSFQLGGSIVDAGIDVGMQKGDPSQSFAVAVEQYRVKYVFLAPDDYDVSFVDIVQPMGASLTLDGAPVGVAPVAIMGGSGYGTARVKLGAGKNGAHVLTGDKPFGIQVSGYGQYTSYQYPGGSNLTSIAPPPAIVH